MKWLIIALAALAAVYGLLELTSSRKSRPQPLFPSFKVDLAAKITMHGPGSKVALEKKNGVWVVSSEAGYPAEADAVKRVLDAVATFNRKDIISSNPEKQALYQVDTTGVAASIEDGGGKTIASFVVGRLGPDYETTYVKDAGSNTVILAPGYLGPVFSHSGRPWQDKRIFNIDPAGISEAGMTKPGLDLVLKRGDDGKWALSQPAGAEIDTNKANKFVRSLAYLRCEDFAGHAPMVEAGLDNPDSSAWFKTSDGAEERLLVGHAATGDRYYVKTAKGDVIYLVGGQIVRSLLPDVASLAPSMVEPGAPEVKPAPPKAPTTK